jgi:hypothetical protein
MICPLCGGKVPAGEYALHWVRHHSSEPFNPDKSRRAQRLARRRSL